MNDISRRGRTPAKFRYVSVENNPRGDNYEDLIAAFADSHGGTLLIGIDNDGEVLGLENDYHSLGDIDRDKYERALSLMTSMFRPAMKSVGQTQAPEAPIRRNPEITVEPVRAKRG